MSKNKYMLPFVGKYYIEFGGTNKEDSHSWNINSERYAYDFEMRDQNNLPYHDEYMNLDNYYCYQKPVLAPCDGYVIDICNAYNDTKIQKNRPIVNDINNLDHNNVFGNYIIIKHKYNEYSVIGHLLKDSFEVKLGDLVIAGQEIAKVGSSGNSNGPHIHYHVQDGINYEIASGIKINFKNINIIRNNKKIYRKYVKYGEFVQNKK